MWLAEINVRGFECQLAAPGHGVARVHGQIDNDLLDLTWIGAHGSKVRGRKNRGLDILADQPAKHRFNATDNVIEANVPRLEYLLTAEGEKLLGQLLGADLGLPDCFNTAAHISQAF